MQNAREIFFCQPDSDVNQFRLGSSILKHAGSRGAASMGGVGVKPSTQKKKLNDWIFPWKYPVKNQFSDFYFFELWSYLYSKYGQFSMNFHHSSKNKNLIYDFSFDSAHSAYFIKYAPLLRRGDLHILRWETSKFSNII